MYNLRGYYDRGKFSSIYVTNMKIFYWSVLISSRIGGDWLKGDGLGFIVVLGSYKFHFIKVHDNLV